MTKKDFQFSVEIYDSGEELAPGDAELLTVARAATKQAYAPYSKFLVGSAAILENGVTVAGTNQENASFPVGICSERVLLSIVASQYPGLVVKTIAISYNNLLGESDHPISPCGICRQSLAEYEERVNHPIRVIMGGMKGHVYIIESASQLLPLSFSASDLG